MAGSDLPERGRFSFTAFTCLRAPGMEAASGRRLDRARDIALQNNPLAAIRFVNLWDCGKKRPARLVRRAEAADIEALFGKSGGICHNLLHDVGSSP